MLKGFHIAAVSAVALASGFASAQNLLTNPDFEVSGLPSLSGWTATPITVTAKASTFTDVTDAAYIRFIGRVSQGFMAVAGDTYQLSGEAALKGLSGDLLTVNSGLTLALTETNVKGDFSYSFTATKSAEYYVSFGSANLFGNAEVSNFDLKNTTAVPEPCSIGALGLGVVGLIRRRRRV